MKNLFFQTRWTNARFSPIAATCIMILGIALSLVSINFAPANSMAPRPHCEVCRRFTDTSPARINTSYRFGRRTVSYQLCSLFCYLEFIEDHTEDEQLSTRIVNFNTIDQEMELQLNVERAYFLYGIEGDEQKTQEPYCVAFGTENEASEAQEELGGKILRFEEVVEIVTELTDEYEPEKPGPRHPPNKRIPR